MLRVQSWSELGHTYGPLRCAWFRLPDETAGRDARSDGEAEWRPIIETPIYLETLKKVPDRSGSMF